MYVNNARPPHPSFPPRTSSSLLLPSRCFPQPSCRSSFFRVVQNLWLRFLCLGAQISSNTSPELSPKSSSFSLYGSSALDLLRSQQAALQRLIILPPPSVSSEPIHELHASQPARAPLPSHHSPSPSLPPRPLIFHLSWRTTITTMWTVNPL